jgi:sigma-B regulation protein RsbU (phosphoserine phosphatase)
MACGVHQLRLVHFSADRFVDGSPFGPRWELGAFRLLADSRAAGEHVGGDFYAFEQRDDKRLTIVIGDACGRGKEGASLLPSVLPRYEALARCSQGPAQLLGALNRGISQEMPADRFVTGASFELDAGLGTLTVANAGHVPAILRSASGEVRVIGRASGPPLGILADCRYADEQHRIGEGDVIVFMTDGILETVETDLARMPTLTRLVANAPRGGRGVHRHLLERVDGYAPELRRDDMTLLSLEVIRRPRQPSEIHPTFTG